VLPVAEACARPRAAKLAIFAAIAATISMAAVVLWRGFAPASVAAPGFTLIDQDAQPFTLSALRGHPVVLFFGYTHCPDECPTTLARLAKAVRAPDVPPDVRISFVTVDPARDSPAVLKRYVRLFDPAFSGLTGSLAALNRVYAAYHVGRQAGAAARGRGDDAVSHGTTVYYLGRDGSIKGFGQWDDAVAEIARNLRDFQ
jgi:protein SCO1/2